MKKFNMIELKLVSTPMSMVVALDPDENGEAIDQRVQENDQLHHVPHSNTVGYSVRRVPLCTLLGLSTFFTSDGSSVNL
jgi:hypothetical protein